MTRGGLAFQPCDDGVEEREAHVDEVEGQGARGVVRHNGAQSRGHRAASGVRNRPISPAEFEREHAA